MKYVDLGIIATLACVDMLRHYGCDATLLVFVLVMPTMVHVLYSFAVCVFAVSIVRIVINDSKDHKLPWSYLNTILQYRPPVMLAAIMLMWIPTGYTNMVCVYAMILMMSVGLRVANIVRW